MNKFLCQHQVLNHQTLGYNADTLAVAPHQCTVLRKFQDIKFNNKVIYQHSIFFELAREKFFVTPLQLHDHSSFLSGILGDMAKMQHFFSQFSRQLQNK